MIVYGTRILSDVDLPLDLSHHTAARFDVELVTTVPALLKNSITYGFPFSQAHGREVYLYSDREFNGSHRGQPWCYEVKDVVRFYWVGGEPMIFFELDEKGNVNLMCFWFIHLLLPLYFTLEERYNFLHAGAVDVDDKPVLFIAPSMGGKSTMTDYFIRQGHSLVSDDKVATFLQDGKYMAVGSHPHHRPYRKFEELGYHVNNFTEDFKPIHAFYVLKQTKIDAEFMIEEIRGFEKFNTLLPNNLYMFSYLNLKRLKYLSQMLNSIRFFCVRLPWDMERLGEVYREICEHSKGVK